jgi:hypothetical protein
LLRLTTALLRLTNRSVEDAPQIIDSTIPVARVSITFGGPQAHAHSLTRHSRNQTGAMIRHDN